MDNWAVSYNYVFRKFFLMSGACVLFKCLFFSYVFMLLTMSCEQAEALKNINKRGNVRITQYCGAFSCARVRSRVVLLTYHAKRMRRIILSSVASLDPPYFPTMRGIS